MSLADYEITFAGAGQQPISLHRGSRFIRILEADSDVYIKVGSRSEIKRTVGQQIDLGVENDGATQAVIRSAIAQTVTLVVSTNRQDDDRANINATINTAIEPGNDNQHLPKVTVGAGVSLQIAAANANRKSLRVAMASDEVGPVSLGKAGIIADQGGLLEPGMVDYIDTAGVLYARNDNASAVDVWVMEINKL